MGRLVSVAVGDQPGLTKRAAEVGRLIADYGLEGDRHAGSGPRQLSLLDASVVDALRAAGATVEPGALGENLLIADVPLDELRPGVRLRIGAAIVEITQARPVCKSVRTADARALKVLAGRPGQMARVVISGEVRPGDPVRTVDDQPAALDDSKQPEHDDQAHRHA